MIKLVAYIVISIYGIAVVLCYFIRFFSGVWSGQLECSFSVTSISIIIVYSDLLLVSWLKSNHGWTKYYSMKEFENWVTIFLSPYTDSRNFSCLYQSLQLVISPRQLPLYMKDRGCNEVCKPCTFKTVTNLACYAKKAGVQKRFVLYTNCVTHRPICTYLKI